MQDVLFRPRSPVAGPGQVLSPAMKRISYCVLRAFDLPDLAFLLSLPSRFYCALRNLHAVYPFAFCRPPLCLRPFWTMTRAVIAFNLCLDALCPFFAFYVILRFAQLFFCFCTLCRPFLSFGFAKDRFLLLPRFFRADISNGKRNSVQGRSPSPIAYDGLSPMRTSRR